METTFNKPINNILLFPPICEYLTYKEWKLVSVHFLYYALSPCEYLTYKEWKLLFSFLFIVFSVIFVSTLPIRNGNKISHFFSPIFLKCEYLTYKEWKHGKPYITIHFSHKVSTLPIRNGNYPILPRFCR